VPTDHVARLRAEVLSQHMSAVEACDRVCLACVDLLDVDGAALILFGDEGHVGTMSVSDAVMARLEELQFVLGEGPGVEAHASGRMVWEPDLAGTGRPRWTAYASAAADEGIKAVFAFPVRTGGVRLGALDVYRRAAGPLDRAQTTIAVQLAELATAAMLFLPPGMASQPGRAGIEVTGRIRARVHQAAGMISEQLEVTVGEALARLRAYAYAENEPIDDVAGDVIARRLRLNTPPE
jgi:hypothetical protein